MNYVYFLLLSNGNVYKGSTGDLRRRFSEHEQGQVSSTKHFRPVHLVGYES
ncbi:MAG: GIY-YIG nuclease family protein, partial [Patescibacteria group bacterium]